MPLVEEANSLDLHTYIARFLPSCEGAAKHAVGTNPDKGKDWSITVASSASITRSDFESCFRLIESTSKADYLSSGGGWHPRAKKSEMKLPDMRYLLVHNSSSEELQAFVSFMMTYEDGFAVVYVYEIHVTEPLRGKGVGKRLMKLIEDAGRKAGMKKAMLTVFTANEGANAFYKARGYEIDPFSPEPRRLRGGKVKEPDYTILSIPLP